MDKNQATGLVVMVLFLMGYFYFFGPKEDAQNTPQTNDTTMVAQETPKVPSQQEYKEKEELSDSLKLAIQQQKLGVFAEAAEGEEEIYSLENELVKIDFSNKGGLIQQVSLKKFDDYQYNFPLVLIDKESSQFDYIIEADNRKINLADLYFDEVRTFSEGDSSVIEFTMVFGDGNNIKHTYYLGKDSYQIHQKSDLDGIKSLSQDQNVHFNWYSQMKRLETNIEDSRMRTAINYYLADGSSEQLTMRSKDREEQAIMQPINWISFRQKFFTSAIIGSAPFDKAYVALTPRPETDTLVVKDGQISLDFNYSYLNDNHFTFYFGPNKLKILKKVTEGFGENLELGWPIIKWINQYLILPIFNFLEKYIGNYGIIIILLVLFIRTLIAPLTYKSQIQMAKTKVLKPELDAIKEQYGDDMQKVQSEQMKLYSKVGVNPLSGCVPLLFQMPILFAMFQFIPYAIELRHEPLLWARDLSTYDSIITLPVSIPFYGDHVSLFTLLMTLSTILYTWANSQQTAAMQGPMKSMQYFMPLIFMFVLNSFPAGLTFYYFISNLVSFGQLSLMKNFVNEDKIKAILEENKKKNATKKKSKFQQRLEEAMKASEDARSKQQVAKKKRR